MSNVPPPAAQPVGGGQQINPLAIASLVCSLVCWGIGSIAAIVLGRMAKQQIAESGGTQSGEGLAQAGIIIGIVGLVLAVLYVILIVAAS